MLSKEFISKHLLSVCLAALTLLAILTVGAVAYIQGSQSAKDISETLGGAGTAVALFWIIGGFLQQRAELGLQRQELSLQRLAHQQQVEELRKAYKLSLRQELARMLSDAYNSLTSTGGKLADFSQIGTAVMLSGDWKIAYESTDPNVVMEASSKYFSVAGKVIIFMHTLAAAAKMHFDAESIAYTEDTDSAKFIYVHSAWLTNVYPFRDYIGPATIAAQFLVMLEPGIESIKFAGIAAGIDLVSSDIVHLDKMLPDYLFLKERGILPAIGKKVAHVFEEYIRQQSTAV